MSTTVFERLGWTYYTCSIDYHSNAYEFGKTGNAGLYKFHCFPKFLFGANSKHLSRRRLMCYGVTCKLNSKNAYFKSAALQHCGKVEQIEYDSMTSY